MPLTFNPTKQPDRSEFVMIMALLMSIIALTIDIMLPAVAAIDEHFALQEDNHRQAIVTLVFVGLMAGQLLFGPLSDHIGRRPAIAIGIALHVVGSCLCIFAPSYEVLLFGRFLQGFGGAGPRIVVVAMIRDRFVGKAMAQIMSIVLTAFILVPTLAPVIGQTILLVGTWQSVFVGLLLTSLIGGAWLMIRQPETHLQRHAFNAKHLLAAMKETVTTPVSLLYALTAGCTLGTLLGYVVSSQQILQDIYQTGDLFAVYFGVTAAFLALATLANTHLLKSFSMERISVGAIVLQVTWTLAWLAWITLSGDQPTLLGWLIFISINLFLVGLTFGNFNAIALRPLGHIAGIASSVTASIHTLVSVAAASLIGAAFTLTVTPVVLGSALLGLSALGLMALANRYGPPNDQTSHSEAGV